LPASQEAAISSPSFPSSLCAAITYLYSKLNQHIFSMKGVYTLKGVVKHYDWGGFSFIPSLLKQENGEKKPFAEYWLGTHPLGVSTVEFEKGATGGLDSLAGNLPYLFKAQEVKEMLSIQAHCPRKCGRYSFGSRLPQLQRR
jgi:hypothetical protein